MSDTNIRFSGQGVRNHQRMARMHTVVVRQNAGQSSAKGTTAAGSSGANPTASPTPTQSQDWDADIITASSAPKFTTVITTDGSGHTQTHLVGPTPTYGPWKPTWPKGPEGPHRPPTYWKSTAFKTHPNYKLYGMIGAAIISPFILITFIVTIYRIYWRWVQAKDNKKSSFSKMNDSPVTQPPRALVLGNTIRDSVQSNRDSGTHRPMSERMSQLSQKIIGRHSVISQPERSGPPMLTTYNVEDSEYPEYPGVEDDDKYPFAVQPPALPIGLQVGRNSPTPDQFRRFTKGALRSPTADIENSRRVLLAGMESLYLERDLPGNRFHNQDYESAPPSPSDYSDHIVRDRLEDYNEESSKNFVGHY